MKETNSLYWRTSATQQPGCFSWFWPLITGKIHLFPFSPATYKDLSLPFLSDILHVRWRPDMQDITFYKICMFFGVRKAIRGRQTLSCPPISTERQTRVVSSPPPPPPPSQWENKKQDSARRKETLRDFTPSFTSVSVSASSFTLLSHSLRLNLSWLLYSLLSFSSSFPFPSFVLFSHSLCPYSTRVSFPFHLHPKFLSLLSYLVTLIHSTSPGPPMLLCSSK